VPEQPDPDHRRPDGTDDATVAAVGKISEAYEWLIRARGALYTFHQEMGRADLTLGEAVEQLRAAGHDGLADRVATEWSVATPSPTAGPSRSSRASTTPTGASPPTSSVRSARRWWVVASTCTSRR
jgi:hypothetical protein